MSLSKRLEIKLKKELKEFKEGLLKLEKNQIFNFTYELMIKEELTYIVYKLTKEEIEFIYYKNNSLDYLYYLWMKNDINLVELIDDPIIYELNKEI